MAKLVDLTGQRFSRLMVLERAENDKRGEGHWLCLCECGTYAVIRGSHLRSSAITSCGCFKKEQAIIHGHTVGGDSPEYSAWHSMIQRCSNPSSIGYRHYGGRGIKVCDRWRNSFEAFIEDMGPRPGKGYSIDRIDNDGNYEPGNCRWATRTEQARNCSRNRMVIHGGEAKSVAEWAERCGLSYATLSGRLRRGWSAERALTTPVCRRGAFA